MGANYDNGMREVHGMRNDIINEFRRLNPNAAYAPPPPPPAPPGAGAVARAPPPMSEHPDAVYEEPAGVAGSAAPSNAGSAGGGGGSAAMSIDPSVHTEPVAPVAPEAEAMDIDPKVPAPVEVPEASVVPPAPQDPFHVGGHAESPVAEGLVPEEPNFINLGDADEPLLEQLFPDMVDGATATETSSEGLPSATTRSRGTSTVNFDNANRPMELEFQQPAVAPEVTPPPDEILPGERRNPQRPDEIIPDQEQITHQNREGTPEPAVTQSPDEILPGERRNPRGPEEIITNQEQITHRNQEEEDDRQLACRPQAWQEYAEQARMDRGLTPQRPPAMHLADMAAAMENGTRRRGRGIINRPSMPQPGSLPAPQPPQPAPVFDQTNQQNMLEHMDTPDSGVGGATGTIPGFPEVPADLESITFDAFNFPDFPGYLNSGPPTSPATAATFIDDYLNAPQGLLGFEGKQPSPDVPEPTAPATAPLQEVVAPLQELVPAPIAGATGMHMTAGTTQKPRSPRRSRSPPSNPNRLIAPNTPAEGIRRPLEDSTRDSRSQTPDARAASPEEEDVNAIPTKGPLGVRKNTIAAKKRATELAKARETARTQSARSSVDTVQLARRSTRPNIPQPGAMAISPETSIPSQQQMPTDEEETDSESDTAIRRRRRSNSANQASSSSKQNSDEGPSQAR
jgi:hypothetical protein